MAARRRARRLAVVLLAVLRALPTYAATPNYDAFSDRDGRITTKEHGLGLFRLVSSAVELEAVFEDGSRGNARAKRVFAELETSYFPDTGRELAELVSQPPCLVPVLRELSGWCVPNWSFLDFLSKEKPGGVRLRVALLNGFMERARQRNLENRLILSAMTSILGVSVVANALREAGIAAGGAGRAIDLLRPGGELIGQAGSSSRIRILQGGQAEAEALFNQLVRETGATPVAKPGLAGFAELPEGGGSIGFRTGSTSGPPTIDVRIPGLGVRELKFVP